MTNELEISEQQLKRLSVNEKLSIVIRNTADLKKEVTSIRDEVKKSKGLSTKAMWAVGGIGTLAVLTLTFFIQHINAVKP